MNILPRSITKLIESLEKLPGVGPKTASRLAFYLLHVPQKQLEDFGNALMNLRTSTVYCSNCFNIGESNPCLICHDDKRDFSTICVVEQPIDILSIEKTAKYQGVYHVLHGAINPLDNIGPDEIRIFELIKRISSGKIKEVILATNANMEGEATAMYIKRELTNSKYQIPNKDELKITRLAHGIPIGADLEYADEITLTKALEGRREF